MANQGKEIQRCCSIRRTVVLSRHSSKTISTINTTLHHYYIAFTSFHALNGDYAFSKNLVKRPLGHWNHPGLLVEGGCAFTDGATFSIKEDAAAVITVMFKSQQEEHRVLWS